MLFTPIVVRNLLRKPATRLYPAVVREPFPKFRGELYIDIKECIFCGTCSRKCPSQCIEVDKDAGTWKCDPYACIYCGVCVESCPTKCLHMKDVHRMASFTKDIISEKGEPPKSKKKAAAEPAAEETSAADK